MTPRLDVPCRGCRHPYRHHYGTRFETLSYLRGLGKPDCERCTCPKFTRKKVKADG